MEFADAMVRAPVGAAVLATLEQCQRPDVSLGVRLGFEVSPDSQTDAVAAAVEHLATMTFGELCSVAVQTGESVVGPWAKHAPQATDIVLALAGDREPIAVAIADRFAVELHAPMDPANQQWWATGVDDQDWRASRRRFERFDEVYGLGEFTYAGLWTNNDTSDEVHDDLVSAWDFLWGPIGRLRLPVMVGAKVYEIHRPTDWSGLVAANAAPVRPSVSVNRPGAHLADRYVPDWAKVASSYDAVHLSWAGFITAHDLLIETGPERFTMLRHWGSERTLWLKDCFGNAEPAPPPKLSGRISGLLSE